MSPAPRLSIIVPIGPQETEWHSLIQNLAEVLIGLQARAIALPAIELILACVDPLEIESVRMLLPAELSLQAICSDQGRARQLNAGALGATGTHLWFLHADSKITSRTFAKLLDSLPRAERALLYFDLRFIDGMFRYKFNELGVFLRCRLFGLPFGDQGFLIGRELFFELGAYDEVVRYGEDHLLVWAAKQTGIAVRPIGATIGSSARKYRERGWINTTQKHCRLFVAQAWPEWKKLAAIRIRAGVGTWKS